MSIKHVTAYYVDAQDGRPANEAPLRHGPALPSDALTVTAVDRRESPPLIIGTLPASEPLSPGMQLIDEAEHTARVIDIEQWRESNAQRELEKKREGMVVSAFQAFAALDAAGYLDQVEVMMADPETPRVHRLAFEKAQEFRRNSDTVNAWKERLELTDQQVDELFEHAATIVA
ncbi:hypothetical protein JJO83_13850 [Halomonas aquamarina]|uniref:hypothetical protein n=1 Tax=Vreelandella aquamarina TaxID=77097 RepID=UPI002359CAE2|nr:hypothetical protein [Halomonas aquamarina]MDC8443767.1 hypothetical protein [Halomonas aquamarina]